MLTEYPDSVESYPKQVSQINTQNCQIENFEKKEPNLIDSSFE